MPVEQEQLFAYSDQELNALEHGISKDRLAPYLALASGEKKQALKLYERNTLLSEALYGPLQALEVVTRNAIHRELTKIHGVNWFTDGSTLAPILAFEQCEKLAEAQKTLSAKKKQITPGRVVAELSFGFWVSLCSKQYLVALFIPCLKGAFRQRLSRAVIFDRLDRLRILRNRVAHHESIIGRDLKEDYRNTVEAISWVCVISSRWVESTSCFMTRFSAQ